MLMSLLTQLLLLLQLLLLQFFHLLLVLHLLACTQILRRDRFLFLGLRAAVHQLGQFDLLAPEIGLSMGGDLRHAGREHVIAALRGGRLLGQLLLLRLAERPVLMRLPQRLDQQLRQSLMVAGGCAVIIVAELVAAPEVEVVGNCCAVHGDVVCVAVGSDAACVVVVVVVVAVLLRRVVATEGIVYRSPRGAPSLLQMRQLLLLHSLLAAVDQLERAL